MWYWPLQICFLHLSPFSAFAKLIIANKPSSGRGLFYDTTLVVLCVSLTAFIVISYGDPKLNHTISMMILAGPSP